MDEDQLQALRRQNLADWVKNAGGPAAVCRAKGLSRSYPSYISQTISGGSFAARGARNAEVKLGMPTGWLDVDHSLSPTTQLPATAGATPDLPQALRLLANALQHVAVAHQRELVKVFELLVDHPDEPDYVARLAKLLGNAGPGTASEKRQSNGR